MFATSHVFAGALVGVAAGDRPAAAFAVGVASHVAMDLVPHWADPDLDEEGFLRVARRDGLIALAAAAALTAAAGPRRRAVLAGIAGAVALDADKPSRHFFGWNPFEGPIARFHVAVQREAPHRMRQEVVAATLLGLGSLAAFGARRLRARWRAPAGAADASPPRPRRVAWQGANRTFYLQAP